MLDLTQAVIGGFEQALSVENVVLVLFGVAMGTFIGMMPGLGAPTGVAVLLPLTLGLEPLSALILLAGVYYGTQYGGSITAILLSTPGDAAQVMTAHEGYKLARKGRGGQALAISALASWFGGTVTIPILMVLMPALSAIALNFGPPELAALMIFGLICTSSLIDADRRKALVAAVVGITLATVGLAPTTMTPRFTFGSTELLAGINFVPVVIGLFAIGEVFSQVGTGKTVAVKTRLREMLLTKDDLRRTRWPMVRGSLIGFLVGVLPGAGATVASFFGYDAERRISKNRGKFGTGVVEGVAAPEAANNSAVNGGFVPTLTLGVPGSATTAILLGALIVHGITPGPSLMTDQRVLVFGLLASFLIGNLALLVLNLPMAPVFAMLLRIPYGYLYPVVIGVSLLGAYAVENNFFHVWTAGFFGLIGYLMRVTGYPVAPLVLGLLLGSLLEPALIQTSRLGYGDLTPLLTRPIALIFVGLSVLMMVTRPLMVLLRLWRHRGETEGIGDDRIE